MIKYTLMLLVAFTLVIAGCTPPATNTNTQTEDDATIPAGGGSASGGEAGEATDGQEIPDIAFNVYTNPSVGYSIKIPTNWYWQHFHKAVIGDANPNVDDYLLISPSHAITGFQTESPAEIIVEVSGRDIADFADSSVANTTSSVAGQSATRLAGAVNNEVFSNYQKIEYQFTREGKTFRITYLASAGLTNNEAVFEEMVKSFGFNE